MILSLNNCVQQMSNKYSIRNYELKVWISLYSHWLYGFFWRRLLIRKFAVKSNFKIRFITKILHSLRKTNNNKERTPSETQILRTINNETALNRIQMHYTVKLLWTEIINNSCLKATTPKGNIKRKWKWKWKYFLYTWKRNRK